MVSQTQISDTSLGREGADLGSSGVYRHRGNLALPELLDGVVRDQRRNGVLSGPVEARRAQGLSRILGCSTPACAVDILNSRTLD